MLSYSSCYVDTNLSITLTLLMLKHASRNKIVMLFGIIIIV